MFWFRRVPLLLLPFFGWILLGSSTVEAAGPGDAINWLKQQQQTNGSWGGTKSSAGSLETTSAVLEALAASGQGTGTPTTKAWTYLQSAKPTTAGEFARRIIAASRIGQTPVASDLTKLLALQQTGGGFAPSANHQATVLDTSLALLAMAASRNQKLGAAQSALSYLTAKQRKDGSWGFFDSNNDPSAYLTGLAMLALGEYSHLYNLSQALTNASGFLKGKQGANGSWGTGRDSILDTSLAVLGLLATKQDVRAEISKAAKYLTQQQAQNGSLANEDPFTTAYAARAMDAERPDLSIKASEVVASPKLLVLGGEYKLDIKVHNTGTKVAQSVVVRLYLGDPQNNGQKVDEKTIPQIGLGSTSTQTMTWKNVTPVGPHYLYLVVDPDAKIAELNERNNTVVWGARVLPPVDLEVTTRNIILKPTFPAPGAPVEIRAIVQNKGGIDVQNVEVAFYDGDPASGGKQWGTTQVIPTIQAGKEGEAKITTPNLPQGKKTAYVVVDPSNKTKDSVTTNNKASKEVNVQPRVDLLLSPQGIFFSQKEATEGDIVEIRIGVYNAEATTATDAVVRIYDGSPNSGGTQIGSDLKVTVPGYKAVYTTPIKFSTFGKPGSRLIYAVVDPDNKFPDIQTTNNVALRTLKVKGLPDPSVTASGITFSPTVPNESSTLRVYATVTNKGFEPTQSGAKLLYYDIDPSQQGAEPFGTATIGAIQPNATGRYSVTWSPIKRVGTQSFWVVVDPAKERPDRDRNNNTATQKVTINDSTYPDFAVTDSDISFSPSRPEAGKTVTIQARVHSRFRRPMTNIVVRFHNGSPTTTNKIGETTITQLQGYGNALATIQWQVPSTLSNATIYVQVDPDNKIRETTTSNNRASKYVQFELGQATAPSNFTVTTANQTDLKFTWQAGSGAAIAKVLGYRIYCNEGLLNPPVVVSGVTAQASSESSTSYTASKSVDLSTGSYWRPKGTSNEWVEFTLPQTEPIDSVQFYFYSTYSRTYELQAWLNNQWTTLGKKTSDNTQVVMFDFASPVTTNRFRYLIPSMSSSIYAALREIRFIKRGLVTGTSYTHTQTYAGNYKCFALGETAANQFTPRSNESSTKIEDVTAPGVPTNISGYYNPSLYENRISWNAPTSSDLAGFQVYSDYGLNVAHMGRGGQVFGPELTRSLYYFNNGSTSTTYVSIPNPITIQLRQTYNIYQVNVLLSSSNSYSYRLESSTDGKTYTTVVPLVKDANGLQEHKFQTPIAMRYVRVVPQGNVGSNFYLGEVEALTKDLALATTYSDYSLRRYRSPVTGTSFWSNNWQPYTYDYKTSANAPRQFLLRNVALSPREVVTISDLDTGQVLFRISGQHELWKSPWLKAKNYRIQALLYDEGASFMMETVLTRNLQTNPTYGHTNIYNNGTYKYAASSVDNTGNESGVSGTTSVTVNDTTAPSTPTNLKATATNKQVKLTWSASYIRDRRAYFVYRNGQKIDETTSTTYTDTNVTNGVTYSYEVSSVDFNNNESSKAGPVKATPTAIDLSFSNQGAFADLFISPKNPSVYETALIILMVRNIGTQNAGSGVEVDLYDGDTKTGTKIGTITLTNAINAGAGAIGSIDWKLTTVKPGTHTITAVIDPSNKIPELNENNNQATIEVTVHADRYLATFVNQIDISKFPQVDVFMSVKDGNGGGLYGLDERNFKVWEDGTRELPITVKQLTQPTKVIPKADIVFVIDTSGSMNNEWQTVCQVIDDIRDLLLASRIDTQVTTYGLAAKKDCGINMTKVIWRGTEKTAHSEDWGPGSTWAALKHTWRKDATRIIIPISDEGAYAGSGWSAEDTEAVNEMIKAAQSTKPQAIFYPFWGVEVQDSNIIATDMKRAAKATGGEAFPFKNATQVVQAIVRGVQRSISDYQITYTTHNTAKDGTLRKVKTETTYNVSKGTAEGEYTAPLDNMADLLFVKGITTTPDPLVPGQTGQLTVHVRNNGGVPAQNILVRFTINGGLVIGERTITSLNPAQTVVVSVPWRALPAGGKIVVLLDPNNTVKESNESNNRVEEDLKLPGTRGTDLAVTSYGLSITPIPAAKGQKVKLAAQVYNLGQNDVKQVLVSFFRGDPQQGGTSLGSTTLASISKGQSAQATINHVLLKEGDFDLWVVVDPYDAIAEASEDNNTANRKIVVTQRDLLLTVKTDKTNYPANTDVNIEVTLTNQMGTPWSGRGEVWIVDKDDNAVDKVADFTPKDIASVGLKGWPYRMPVSWTAPAKGTKDFFLGIKVNFTQALASVGQTGKALNEGAIRVAFLDTKSQEYKLVPFQFQKANTYDASTNASGHLVVFFQEAIAAGTAVKILVFFDINGGTSPSTPKVLPFPKTGHQLAYIEDNGKFFLKERLPDGTWSAEISVADITTSGDRSRGIALGDFNQDGVMDLVTASGADHKVYFYPGKAGDPKRFDVAARKEVGSISTTSYEVMAMAVADVNNDGKLDIVFSRYYYVYWMLGNGDGTFQATKNYRMPSSSYRPYGKVLIDYDKDGDLDIVAGTYYQGYVYLIKNDGNGGFGSATRLLAPSKSNVYGLAVYDFDNDGNYDILLNNSSSGDAFLYYSDGKGGWKTAVTIPSLDTNNYTSWAMADWNYDGQLDLFAATYSTKTVLLFTGNGTSFTKGPQLNTTSANILGLAVGHPSPQVIVNAGQAQGTPVSKWSFKWNTNTSPAGPYKVHVKLFETDGIVADAKSNFTVDPDVKAKAELTTDRLAYPANAPVSFVSRITNDSVNTTYDQLKGSIVIEDAQNKQVAALSFNMANLLRGQFKDQAIAWNTSTNTPGKYTAKLSVEYQGKEIATSSTTFDILTSAESGIGLLGTLEVKPGLAQVGDALTITFEVTNIGNQAFTNHDIQVRIFSDADRQEKDSIPEKLTVAVQKSQKFIKTYDTSKLDKGTYTLLLTTKLGTKEFSLDAATLQLEKTVERPKLTVKITSPTQGETLPSVVVAVSGDVADGDAVVTVNGVTAQVTGASAQASSFAAQRVNLNACESVIEAKATRGNDTASDQLTVSLPHRSIVAKEIKATQNKLTAPAAVAAGLNNTILVSDADKGIVTRLELDSQQTANNETEVVKDLKNPGTLFEDADGNIYVAEVSDNEVIRIDKSGKKETWMDSSNGLLQPAAFASDGKGGLFVASSGNGKIYLIDKSQKIELYTDGLQQPVGLGYDSTKGVLYVLDKADGQVYQIDKLGEKPKSVAGNLPGEAASLALIGTWVIASDRNDNAIYAANLSTNKVQMVAGLLKGVSSIAALNNDTLAMATDGNGVVVAKLAQLKCRDDEPGAETSDEPTTEPTADASEPELQFEKNIVSDKSETGDRTSGEPTLTEGETEKLLPPSGCGCDGASFQLPIIPVMLFLGLFLLGIPLLRRRRHS